MKSIAVRNCEYCGCELQGWEINICEKCAMTNHKKLGRPPSPRGVGNWLPARQLGRVSDEDWAVIREACEVSGQSLVEWGLPLLLREARKRIQKENRK